jgi:hypothetical protein
MAYSLSLALNNPLQGTEMRAVAVIVGPLAGH